MATEEAAFALASRLYDCLGPSTLITSEPPMAQGAQLRSLLRLVDASDANAATAIRENMTRLAAAYPDLTVNNPSQIESIAREFSDSQATADPSSYSATLRTSFDIVEWARLQTTTALAGATPP